MDITTDPPDQKQRRASSKKLENEVRSSLAPEEKKKLPQKLKIKRKLNKVAEKNETLTKTINEKNAEISDLKRSVQSLNEVINSVPIDELRCNSSIASSKILELSKKNRQLRAELETTKNRANKKDMIIAKLERDLKLIGEKHQDPEAVKKATGVEELQVKLNAIQQKLFETRNKNHELQSQLKQTQKYLQQEVGDQFNISKLSANSSPNSNWRGRAQQIIHLQQKVNELKERLNISGRGGTMLYMNGFCNSDASIDSNATTKVKQKSAIGLMTTERNSSGTNCIATFDRYAPGVRKSEILHRAKVETLEKEICTLRDQIEEQQKKILALKVRNKTLNDEVIKYKMKSSSLEEQTGYNGLNLTTMNEKINLQKCQFANRMEEMCREMESVQRQYEEAEFRENALQKNLENLEEELAKKDQYIAELSGVIEKLEIDLKAVCGGFLFSCREFRKEEFVAILDSLEVEKNLLMEHNKTLNARIEQERQKNDNATELLSKQKVRMARLDAKLRDLEKDLESQNERKKRSQRVTEYANSVSMTTLNSSLASFTFENSSTATGMNVQAISRAVNDVPEQIADMRHKLEFAAEKIALLEEKISHLLYEKEDDIRTFNEIISNSRNVMLDAIQQHRMGIMPVNSQSTLDMD